MVSVYFDNEIERELLTIISSSKERIYLAVAWFTNHFLFDELMKSLKRNVHIKILILDDILNRNEFGLDFGELANCGAIIRMIKNNKGTMHNKFCVIDDQVITGSYNWTYHANLNQENIVVINDDIVVNKYCKQFDSIFEKANDIPSPYQHIKWEDLKEEDFTEFERIIYRDIEVTKDINKELKKYKLEKLNEAYNSEDKQEIYNASKLPTIEKHTTLFDVLITDPEQFVFKLWWEESEEIYNMYKPLIRKWIFMPNKITNNTVSGYFVPYAFKDDINNGISLSITNQQFINSLVKFIGDRNLDDDTYKFLPEELICIDYVNIFHCPFEKPMFNIKESEYHYPSRNPRYVYGIAVIGIVSNTNWNSYNPETEKKDINNYVYAIQKNKCIGKIEKEHISFYKGWNPYERGKIIQEKFFYYKY